MENKLNYTGSSRTTRVSARKILNECDTLAETYIMTYKYVDNSWDKISDSNQIRLIYERETKRYFIFIIPLIKEKFMIRAYLTQNCHYKRYSKFFHRFKSSSGEIFGFLFLTTLTSQVADTIYDFVQEIIATGSLNAHESLISKNRISKEKNVDNKNQQNIKLESKKIQRSSHEETESIIRDGRISKSKDAKIEKKKKGFFSQLFKTTKKRGTFKKSSSITTSLKEYKELQNLNEEDKKASKKKFLFQQKQTKSHYDKNNRKSSKLSDFEGKESSKGTMQIRLSSKNALHVEFDKETRKLVGLPLEWEKIIEKSFSLPYKYLENIKVKNYISKIPLILVKIKEKIIENEGINCVGIFRVSSNNEEVEIAVQQFNSGNFETCKKPNVLAHLFKKFYRELPNRILNDEILKKLKNKKTEFIVDKEYKLDKADAEEFKMGTIKKRNIVNISSFGASNKISQKKIDGNKNVNEMLQQQELEEDSYYAIEIVKMVKEPAKSMFLFMLDFCIYIMSNKEVNKMGAENLAIVLSPNLFTVKGNLQEIEIILMITEVKKFLHSCILLREKGLI